MQLPLKTTGDEHKHVKLVIVNSSTRHQGVYHSALQYGAGLQDETRMRPMLEAWLTKFGIFVDGLLLRDLEPIGLRGRQFVLSLARHFDSVCFYTTVVCIAIESRR